jgi:hypothetical protein
LGDRLEFRAVNPLLASVSISGKAIERRRTASATARVSGVWAALSVTTSRVASKLWSTNSTRA